MVRRLVVALIALALTVIPAAAEDWIAEKLRGTAEVEVNATWQPLQRGDAVADDQMVRTGPDSRLELTRGAEVIALGPDTEVKIETDLAKSFTIIHQGLGTVDIQAEVKSVAHLEVRNKFLSAVVKGTIFSVTADELGASVQVSRGLVAVEALSSHQTTAVPAGNSAAVGETGTLAVAGGTPTSVYDANGLKLAVTPMPAMAIAPQGEPEAATVEVADASALLPAQTPGSLLVTTTGVASGTAQAASPQGGIDIAAAGIGIAVGIAIGAMALLARRFFA